MIRRGILNWGFGCFEFFAGSRWPETLGMLHGMGGPVYAGGYTHDSWDSWILWCDWLHLALDKTERVQPSGSRICRRLSRRNLTCWSLNLLVIIDMVNHGQSNSKHTILDCLYISFLVKLGMVSSWVCRCATLVMIHELDCLKVLPSLQSIWFPFTKCVFSLNGSASAPSGFAEQRACDPCDGPAWF